MTKVAAKKTAGVLGDDLALNAQQVTGVATQRELPVVWSVAKGSFRNKLILVPAALIISAFAGWAITPLLMLGGAFLCYEGFEKLAHKFLHSKDEETERHVRRIEALADPAVDVVAFEKEKIAGAVRTDFILSAEIIVISLGTVAAATLAEQVAVLSAIALLMTIGVYGLVAGIVKLDDLGLHLREKSSAALRSLGNGIVHAAPYLMKTLSVVGTAAMFMVGGSILTHGLPPVHHAIEAIASTTGGIAQVLLATLLDALFGVIAGAIVWAVVTPLKKRFGQAHDEQAA